MMRRLVRFLWTLLFATILPVLAGICWSQEAAKPAPEAEQELVIVKYGSLSVQSSEPSSRVLIDGADKGDAANVIEGIVVGQHIVSCTAGGKRVSGTFTIKKNETLKLEALFDEGKLVPFREPVKVVQQEKNKPEPVKAEKSKKPSPEPAKAEKSKKSSPEPKKPLPEPTKVEQKNPVEERRKNNLNVIRFDYEVVREQNLQVAYQNVPGTTKVVVTKDSVGEYYRTKQGLLLCDVGPCEMTWKATFLYTDETGKADALLLNWRQIVFNGATPSGTSKRELECCLKGQCWKMQDTSATDNTQEFDIGRYRLSWTKSYVLLRRLDIMKEILTAGRSLSDY